MKRAAFAVLLAACATEKKQGHLETEVAAMQAELAAQQMMRAKGRADAECAAVGGRQVGWTEELFMGTALALGRANTGKTFYDPKAPVQAWVQVVGLSLAQLSARPAIAWTFGVISDPKPAAFSEMGGYVFVTTGLLAKLENEAQLAAALAHEIAHVAGSDRMNEYLKMRLQACNVGVTGAMMVQSGAGGVPGGSDFVADSKFFTTMNALAVPNPLDVSKDPKVDLQFVLWFTNQVAASRQLTHEASFDEPAADRVAIDLLTRAGYDPRALGPVVALLDAQHDAARTAELAKIPASVKGKLPPFPKDLAMPAP